MAEIPVVHLVLDDTLGAMFIGVVVAAALWGVSCVQAWYYYNHYRVDLWHIRLLVTAAFITDTIHQMLITHTLYVYLVTNFGNPLILDSLVWSLLVEVLFNGLTALMVQLFFTIRIWKLSERSIAVTLCVLLLVLAEFGTVFAYTVKALHFSTFTQLAELKALSMTVNALAAAGDVVIAAVLCTVLHRARTGFQHSNNVINRLMIFCVNTGLLTSICAVLSLITISALPNTFIYIAFYFASGRLYLNSLLATLNARRSIHNKPVGPSNFSESISLSFREGTTGLRTAGAGSANTIIHGSHNVRSIGQKTSNGGISVKIETETVQEYPGENDIETLSSVSMSKFPVDLEVGSPTKPKPIA
ncbi:hypothetical protein JAAARDRAFT_673647 [Jaapia argillacea MUCL 33604]|uniref:DUF6534 domain-containing protein n=1 Tax=Jaapia argillacea MUCL 33604 TaxID=933084 RepID=A0A067PV59_9AGAM|nr:hypothetical protein JAAARDRAFT_673647 [Jaapia argillacea MUCL 33604]